uniref:Putative secreted protein n=1 Tax=Amblyomma parvum TaxID=251391 RepID=A0A023FZD0_AMBPA
MSLFKASLSLLCFLRVAVAFPSLSRQLKILSWSPPEIPQNNVINSAVLCTYSSSSALGETSSAHMTAPIEKRTTSADSAVLFILVESESYRSWQFSRDCRMQMSTCGSGLMYDHYASTAVPCAKIFIIFANEIDGVLFSTHHRTQRCHHFPRISLRPTELLEATL